MKKKIINGILMVALVAATSTSFVSCKDNSEDVRTDLLAQVNSDLEPRLKQAEKDIDALEAAHNRDSLRLNGLDDETAALKKAHERDSIRLDGLKADVKGIRDTLNTLVDHADSIDKVTKRLEGRMDTVEYRISTLVEALRKMVTSVTINATSNSILSNSKVFPGLDMQLVGAAYGEPINAKGTFPSKESGLSDAALAGVENLDGYYEWKDGQLIANEDKDGYNAGTIYFTLNPSNTNPNNLKSLTLVNSQNTEIFELGTVKESKEVLTWGITRADGDTFEPTLWEAPVKYDATSVKALELKNIINFSALKNNVKNIIDAAKNADSKASAKSAAKTVLKETASAVANLLNSKIPAMPAVALKATWEDTVGVRSVLSDYSIAATAYKPLSFSEFNGVSLGTDINFTKVDNGFKKILDKVRNELNGIDLSGLKIGTITIDDYSDYNKSQTVWIKITTNYVDKGAPVGIIIGSVDIALATTTKGAAAPAGYTDSDTSAGGTIAGKKVTVTKTDVDADMSAAIQTLIEDKVNGTLSSTNNAIQDVVDQVKNIIKKANDGLDKVESLENSVTDYLESYINRTINFVSSGRFLEPVLLVNSNSGIRRATGTYEAGKYTFVPTTMNYELIAPAFKKYIAVLDKNGKVIAGSQKILTKGEKNFSSVEIDLTTDAAQIVYAAMDFRGYQVAKVYNVTVK